jgi:pimeloyl-ACP methyl ester carboxylesterase
VRDWPADAAALVDALDVAVFGVVGLSGGGPYAAACAAAPALADQVAGAALVSAVPPPALRSRGPATRVLADRYGRAPWLGRAPLAVAGRLARDRPAAFVRLVARGLPDPDRALLDDPTVRTTLIDEVREATRGGAGGPALDGALLGRPWGFDPADVARPGRVTVYHGAADRTVAPGDARAFADAIPGADVRVVDGEGHLSTLVACAGAVLESAAGSIEGT